MAWTTPPNFTTGQVVTAADLNAYVTNNANYLLTRPGSVVRRDNAANYSTTSVTFVNVDTTNLSVSITISGTSILIGFSCGLGTITTTPVSFDFTVDGTRVGVAGTDGMSAVVNNSASAFCMVALVTGLTPGAHTVKIQWRNRGGNSSIMYAGNGVNDQDSIPMLWAVEVG